MSVVIISKNEEKNIERCLKSVDWAAERIVVDSHSADETRSKAAALGALIFERDWPGYGGQKNFGVRAANNVWVLNVDADEEVTPELAEEIREVVNHDVHKGYRVLIPTYFMGRPLKHYGRARHDPGHIRLFRKDAAHFDSRLVHEVVEVDGSVGWLKAPILHFSYPTMAAYWRKIHAYALLEAKERVSGSGKRGNRWFRALGRLGWMLVVRRGLLDGPTAWIWIAGQAYEEWLATSEAAHLLRKSRTNRVNA